MDKFKNFIINNLADLIVVIAILIIAINSILINAYFGFYIIAAELILIAFKLYKVKKE